LPDLFSSEFTNQRAIVVWGILFILVVEMVFGLAQLFSGSAYNSGRGYGTFPHPAVLGKYFLILLPILLPSMSAESRWERRPAVLAVVVGFVATALTVSRSNILAVASVLVAWSLIRSIRRSSRGRIFKRVALPLTVLFLSLPFVSLLLERIEADPDGGDRPALLDAGFRVIAAHPIWGTGPNNYVVSARNSEPIVGFTGYPVHNTFLLGIAELGAIGLILFALPLLVAIASTLKRMRSSSLTTSNYSRAYLLAVVGVAFVGSTSWGFWQEPTLSLMFLVSGMVYQHVVAPGASGEVSNQQLRDLAERRRSE
tara:strand:+ start:4164 stop:5099 length:936 start_codon:yes stop_codon:yes gene_type:complete